MADKSAGSDKPRPGERHNQRRKATLEQVRREQQRKERRKTLLFVSVAVVVAVAIIGVTTFAVVRENRANNRPPDQFGVAADAAGCDLEITDPVSDGNAGNHIASGTRQDYPSGPPDFGPHDGNYLSGSEIKPFFTVDDTPPVERLVHSLEHGYLVYWYDPSLPKDQIDTIQDLAGSMFKDTGSRFIAAPWKGTADNRQALPDGKHVVLTRWGGQQKAWRQYCSSVSGAAAQQFAFQHPATDAPEPGAV